MSRTRATMLSWLASLLLSACTAEAPPVAPAPAPAPLAQTAAPEPPHPTPQPPAAPPPTTEAAEAETAVEEEPEEPSLEDLGCQTALEELLPLASPVPAHDWWEAASQCHQASRHSDALILLQRATAADPALAAAHELRARALLALRAEGPACAHDATLEAVLDALAELVRHQPEAAAALQSEAAYAELRALPRFRLLGGADPRTRTGVVELLQGAVLFAPATGAFGHLQTLQLSASGPAPGSTAGLRLLSRAVAADGSTTHTTAAGSWSVSEQGVLTLQLDASDPASPMQQLRVDARADLREAPDAEGVPVWLSTPEECGA